MNKRITALDCTLREGTSSTIGIFMVAVVLRELSRIWSRGGVEQGNHRTVVKCRKHKEYLFEEKKPLNFLIEHLVKFQDLPDWRVIANGFCIARPKIWYGGSLFMEGPLIWLNSPNVK